MVDGVFFLGKKTKNTLINIGSGYENSIKGYVNFISKKMLSKSKVIFDNNKAMDGTPRKLLDCSVARSYGWKPKFKFSNDLPPDNFLVQIISKQSKILPIIKLSCPTI